MTGTRAAAGRLRLPFDSAAAERRHQLGLCPAHHLACVHRGHVTITAPARELVRFELGVRAEGGPLVSYERLIAPTEGGVVH
ncbi:MAG: hypothetical protein QM767_03865 [Anaeromyxobacter sp.]